MRKLVSRPDCDSVAVSEYLINRVASQPHKCRKKTKKLDTYLAPFTVFVATCRFSARPFV